MNDAPAPRDFIRQRIADDLAAGRVQRVVTRFPPEPNGYLHIGHAKSVCLNFGIAEEFGGQCFLRFDDTNPLRESAEFEAAIAEDVHWLGFDWGDRLRHASDYFEALYDYAVKLIRDGKAYVCDLSADAIRATRGTLTEPGRESPWRNRSVEENLELFARMRAGEFPDGARVLRAKIDMASPNLNLRDPVMYRIRHVTHHRTGDAWKIYPAYDYAHPLSDAIEGTTHSLCTLEFEDHRPLYDWFIDNCAPPNRPRQIEFSRLNLTHTVLSKRRLRRLVDEGLVAGWDDPRMPTLAGLRRRGVPPRAIRRFVSRIGVTRKDALVDVAVLEHATREVLDAEAPRAMAVLRPLRLVIENYPQDREELLTVPNHPADPSFGTRQVPFSRELLIERDDFMLDPPRRFFRLAPGREVRLRFAYLITCTDVRTDPASGEVSEVVCRYDPATRGGDAPDGRRVKGTLHWVSARHAVPATVRVVDRLFRDPDPEAADETGFHDALNPESLTTLEDCRLEPMLGSVAPESRFQFERLGYFCADRRDHRPDERAVFNRIVALRDSWARVAARG